MASSAPRESSLSAVEKAVALLRAIASSGDDVGLSELARTVGIPKSTAFRVLAILLEQGLVDRRGTKYRLGLSAFELGAAASSQRSVNLRDRALPYLEALYESTHETVNLAILLPSGHVLYIEKIHGHRSPASAAHVGGRLPAYATALGKVLLSHDDGVTADLLRRPLRPLTSRTVVQPGLLTAELHRARTDGVAVDLEGCQVGLSCVAAPLMIGSRAVAAISVSAPSSRFDAARLGAAVISTARALTTQVMPSLDP